MEGLAAHNGLIPVQSGDGLPISACAPASTLVSYAGSPRSTLGQATMMQGGGARSPRLVHTQETAGSNPASATIAHLAVTVHAPV